MKLKYKKIAVDFDGTLVEHVPYPEIGKIRPYAAEVIAILKSLGAEIAIWTCRTGDDVEKVKNFLNSNGIIYHYFNENFSSNVKEYQEDSRKIFADCYIDDRALWSPKEIDWLEVFSLLVEEG